MGALYPSSIADDFQTDLITLGKEVIEYHHFDKSFQFNEDDVVLFITATGRTMEYNAKKMVKQNLEFSYQTMMILDLMRIRYYEKFYLEEE